MLCEQLRRIDRIEVHEVANARRRHRSGGGLGSVRNMLLDEWWLSAELPRLAARAGADVIHHPLPARARRTRLPQVVTVHDLAFERLPECFDARFRLYAHLSHRAAVRAAAASICVSETTAADVRELWRVPTERIVVARHGPGQPLPRTPASSPDEPQHFLYVGDDEPRKDLGTLREAYRRYRERAGQPLPLILAGGAAASGKGVLVEPGPSAERLASLYGRAAALIQSSLYEGFGLTALEAMAAGTAVIAARSPGLVEVCGEAAYWVDPRDPDGLADALSAVAEQPSLRRELVERGCGRAAGFSWAESARSHLTAYSLALRRG